MPSGLLDGALPIGLIMFAGMLFTLLRRHRQRGQARRDLPAVAQELGLLHREPRYAGAQGQLRGVLDGHEVIVDPDDERRLLVRLQQPLPLDLRSYDKGPAAPHGWVTVFGGSTALQRLFKTRFASPPLAAALSETQALDPVLTVFGRTYQRQLKSLQVSSDTLTCTLDFGTPPYIPAAAVRELLPACVALARGLQELSEQTVRQLNRKPNEQAAQSAQQRRQPLAAAAPDPSPVPDGVGPQQISDESEPQRPGPAPRS